MPFPTTGAVNGSAAPHPVNAPVQTNASAIAKTPVSITGGKRDIFEAAAQWSSSDHIPETMKNLRGINIPETSLAAQDWKAALEGDDTPKLCEMTNILKRLFSEAKDARCKNLLLVGQYGQIILKPKSQCIKLYSATDASKNPVELEIHPAVNDQLTLAVLNGLYGPQAIHDLLQLEQAKPTDSGHPSPDSSAQTDNNDYFSVHLGGGTPARNVDDEVYSSSQTSSFSRQPSRPPSQPSSPSRSHSFSSISSISLPDAEEPGFSPESIPKEVEEPASNLIPETVSKPVRAPILTVEPEHPIESPSAEFEITKADESLDALIHSLRKGIGMPETDDDCIDPVLNRVRADANSSLKFICKLAGQLAELGRTDAASDINYQEQNKRIKTELLETIRNFMPSLDKSDHPWTSKTGESLKVLLGDLKKYIDLGPSLSEPIVETVAKPESLPEAAPEALLKAAPESPIETPPAELDADGNRKPLATLLDDLKKARDSSEIYSEADPVIDQMTIGALRMGWDFMCTMAKNMNLLNGGTPFDKNYQNKSNSIKDSLLEMIREHRAIFKGSDPSSSEAIKKNLALLDTIEENINREFATDAPAEEPLQEFQKNEPGNVRALATRYARKIGIAPAPERTARRYGGLFLDETLNKSTGLATIAAEVPAESINTSRVKQTRPDAFVETFAENGTPEPTLQVA
jgi:hypothetical protein